MGVSCCCVDDNNLQITIPHETGKWLPSFSTAQLPQHNYTVTNNLYVAHLLTSFLDKKYGLLALSF